MHMIDQELENRGSPPSPRPGQVRARPAQAGLGWAELASRLPAGQGRPGPSQPAGRAGPAPAGKIRKFKNPENTFVKIAICPFPRARPLRALKGHLGEGEEFARPEQARPARRGPASDGFLEAAQPAPPLLSPEGGLFHISFHYLHFYQYPPRAPYSEPPSLH